MNVKYYLALQFNSNDTLNLYLSKEKSFRKMGIKSFKHGKQFHDVIYIYDVALTQHSPTLYYNRRKLFYQPLFIFIHYDACFAVE